MPVLAFSDRGTWARNAGFDAGSGLELIPLGPARASAAVSGGVVRGERNLYSVVARAGQTLSVEIEAAEDNAAFEIYTPAARISRIAAKPECYGETLTDRGDNDSRSWSGRLAATGPYLIAVGPTRGNAAYELSVSLR